MRSSRLKLGYARNQSRNASACQAPSSTYKRGRARPEMVKHALTNGGYFQTLSFVCITYYYTHTQINELYVHA